MSGNVCECGHPPIQHTGPGNSCLYVKKVSESETIVCACRAYKRDVVEVDRYASDHADMAFMSQLEPPKNRILSQAVRMSRALYIYEWAKAHKVMEGDWEIHHSQACIEEEIAKHEENEE